MVQSVRVQDIKVCDYINLSGDQYADPLCDDPYLECEYAVVEEIQVEHSCCISILFEHGVWVRFPPDHILFRDDTDRGISDD